MQSRLSIQLANDSLDHLHHIVLLAILEGWVLPKMLPQQVLNSVPITIYVGYSVEIHIE